MKAIYPGTFDPITMGHLNIIEKASRIFDEVIIGVADFTAKVDHFTLEERAQLCKESTAHLPNVTVMMFSGMVVEFAKAQGCQVMIRGLRAVSDFEYELSLALTNTKLMPEIETLFLLPSLRYMYLSSSMIRQLAELDADLKDFVPAPVARALKDKFAKKDA